MAHSLVGDSILLSHNWVSLGVVAYLLLLCLVRLFFLDVMGITPSVDLELLFPNTDLEILLSGIANPCSHNIIQLL